MWLRVLFCQIPKGFDRKLDEIGEHQDLGEIWILEQMVSSLRSSAAFAGGKESVIYGQIAVERPLERPLSDLDLLKFHVALASSPSKPRNTAPAEEIPKDGAVSILLLKLGDGKVDLFVESAQPESNAKHI